MISALRGAKSWTRPARRPLFEEDETSVAVLILVCGEDDPKDDWMDCPVHIYLEQPLGDRKVIDVVRANRPVPYYNVYRDLQRQFELRGP